MNPILFRLIATRTLSALFLALLLGGCVTKPDSVRPVEPFSLERYLGTGTRSPAWITRLNGV